LKSRLLLFSGLLIDYSQLLVLSMAKSGDSRRGQSLNNNCVTDITKISFCEYRL